jgi:hypothetical protein
MCKVFVVLATAWRPTGTRCRRILTGVEERLLTAGEVGERLRLSERSAHRLMASGAIASCRIGPGERLLRTTAGRVVDYQAVRFAVGAVRRVREVPEAR